MELKKPIEKPENKQMTVPEHSMGIDPNTNKLLIKVDDGKFMDTIYEYADDWFVDNQGVLNYNTMVKDLIINGLTREPVNTTIEDKESFRNEVATPILLHIIKSINEVMKEADNIPSQEINHEI